MLLCKMLLLLLLLQVFGWSLRCLSNFSAVVVVVVVSISSKSCPLMGARCTIHLPRVCVCVCEGCKEKRIRGKGLCSPQSLRNAAGAQLLLLICNAMQAAPPCLFLATSRRSHCHCIYVTLPPPRALAFPLLLYTTFF